MFSEALAIMDRNAAAYMIEELQKELEENKEALVEKNRQERLTRLLVSANRIDDLKRSYEDEDFRQKLFEEFHL